MLTPEEIRLGENVTTTQWLQRYRPASMGCSYLEAKDQIRAQCHAGAGSTRVEEVGKAPCDELLGDAA